jgi:hypothetical protein
VILMTYDLTMKQHDRLLTRLAASAAVGGRVAVGRLLGQTRVQTMHSDAMAATDRIVQAIRNDR